jgi:hypothetical protein
MRFVLSLAAVAAVSSSASAAVIAQWNFNTAFLGAPNILASSLSPDLSASSISGVGSGLLFTGNESPAYATNVLRWQVANTSATNVLASAVNPSYFELTLTPDAGYQITVSDISYDAARGGSGNPRGIVVSSSLLAHTVSLDSFAVPTVRPNLTTNSFTVAGHTNVASPITFRFYGYVVNPNTSMEVDNLTINGSVTLIPEPATLGLLAGASLLALRRR